MEYAHVGGRRGATDTVLYFISQQGDGGGAHDEDQLGKVVIYDNIIDEDDIVVNTGVFYGTEDPYSALG